MELQLQRCTEELMLLNYGVGEDSRESLGLQGDQPVNHKGKPMSLPTIKGNTVKKAER